MRKVSGKLRCVAIKLAEHYNCSVDYLLGVSDVTRKSGE